MEAIPLVKSPRMARSCRARKACLPARPLSLDDSQQAYRYRYVVMSCTVHWFATYCMIFLKDLVLDGVCEGTPASMYKPRHGMASPLCCASKAKHQTIRRYEVPKIVVVCFSLIAGVCLLRVSCHATDFIKALRQLWRLFWIQAQWKRWVDDVASSVANPLFDGFKRRKEQSYWTYRGRRFRVTKLSPFQDNNEHV